MRRGLPESTAERSVPNLAPMVDVIMVILVFFLLGATLTLVREGSLRSELDPRSGPGAGAGVEIIPSVRVALRDVSDGRVEIRVMGRPLAEPSFEGLRRLLAERVAAGADTFSPLIVSADARIRWELVVQAVDAAHFAGFQNVQFGVSAGTAAP